MNEDERDRCPICGHEFDLEEMPDVFDCPSCELGKDLTRDQLIGWLDDYLYCE